MDEALKAAADEAGEGPPLVRNLGLLAGLAVVAALQWVGPPDGVTAAGWVVVSVLALMVVWWITEAVPPAATALLPLVALPVFGVTTLKDAAVPYADPILFLFIGGFMIARAVERWGLHARAALLVASRVGARPSALVGGFILASALLSMWISNTATTLLLAPIAVAVARAMKAHGHDDPAFGAALVLGLAYAASVGGVATPVGSPTNLIAMGFLADRGLHLSFLSWTATALPLVLLLLPIVWLATTFGLKPASADGDAAGRQVLQDALRALGPTSKPEQRVALVFALVAFAWITREVLLVRIPGLERLSDAAVALIGALLLFALPSGGGPREPRRLLDWSTAERIPWGIVLLFGGGLSIAGATETTGLSDWLALQLQGLRAQDAIVVIAVLVVVTLLATETMSNVATLTAMLPVVLALSTALEIAPLLLVFPVSVAASMAFMLPIATGPNAVAYATGLPSLGRMIVVGGVLNAAACVSILLINAFLAPVVLG